MSTVNLVVEKKTFVPEKNYFSCENVRISREETAKEIELWNNMVNWDHRGMAAIGLGLLFCIIFGITFSCIAAATGQSLFYLGIIAGTALFISSVIFANTVCWPKERECEDLRRKWHTEHDDELWAEATKPIKEYNEEQEKIAEAWRAEHPLEELIRACIKDPLSSVEVANLARYYAEVYIKEKSNEN